MSKLRTWLARPAAVILSAAMVITSVPADVLAAPIVDDDVIAVDETLSDVDITDDILSETDDGSYDLTEDDFVFTGDEITVDSDDEAASDDYDEEEAGSSDDLGALTPLKVNLQLQTKASDNENATPAAKWEKTVEPANGMPGLIKGELLYSTGNYAPDFNENVDWSPVGTSGWYFPGKWSVSSRANLIGYKFTDNSVVADDDINWMATELDGSEISFAFMRPWRRDGQYFTVAAAEGSYTIKTASDGSKYIDDVVLSSVVKNTYKLDFEYSGNPLEVVGKGYTTTFDPVPENSELYGGGNGKISGVVPYNAESGKYTLEFKVNADTKYYKPDSIEFSEIDKATISYSFNQSVWTDLPEDTLTATVDLTGSEDTLYIKKSFVADRHTDNPAYGADIIYTYDISDLEYEAPEGLTVALTLNDYASTRDGATKAAEWETPVEPTTTEPGLIKGKLLYSTGNYASDFNESVDWSPVGTSGWYFPGKWSVGDSANLIGYVFTDEANVGKNDINWMATELDGREIDFSFMRPWRRNGKYFTVAAAKGEYTKKTVGGIEILDEVTSISSVVKKTYKLDFTLTGNPLEVIGEGYTTTFDPVPEDPNLYGGGKGTISGTVPYDESTGKYQIEIKVNADTKYLAPNSTEFGDDKAVISFSTDNTNWTNLDDTLKGKVDLTGSEVTLYIKKSFVAGRHTDNPAYGADIIYTYDISGLKCEGFTVDLTLSEYASTREGATKAAVWETPIEPTATEPGLIKGELLYSTGNYASDFNESVDWSPVGSSGWYFPGKWSVGDSANLIGYAFSDDGNVADDSIIWMATEFDTQEVEFAFMRPWRRDGQYFTVAAAKGTYTKKTEDGKEVMDEVTSLTSVVKKTYELDFTLTGNPLEVLSEGCKTTLDEPVPNNPELWGGGSGTISGTVPYDKETGKYTLKFKVNADTKYLAPNSTEFSTTDKATISYSLDNDTWTPLPDDTLTAEVDLIGTEDTLYIKKSFVAARHEGTYGDPIIYTYDLSDLLTKPLPTIADFAKDAVTAAPLVDDPESGEAIKDLAKDYKASSAKNEKDEVIDVTLSAKDLKAHHNGEHTEGYWVGVAIPIQYDESAGVYAFVADDWTVLPDPDDNSDFEAIADERDNQLFDEKDETKAIADTFYWNMTYAVRNGGVVYIPVRYANADTLAEATQTEDVIFRVDCSNVLPAEDDEVGAFQVVASYDDGDLSALTDYDRDVYGYRIDVAATYFGVNVDLENSGKIEFWPGNNDVATLDPDGFVVATGRAGKNPVTVAAWFYFGTAFTVAKPLYDTEENVVIPVVKRAAYGDEYRAVIDAKSITSEGLTLKAGQPGTQLKASYEYVGPGVYSGENQVDFDWTWEVDEGKISLSNDKGVATTVTPVKNVTAEANQTLRLTATFKDSPYFDDEQYTYTDLAVTVEPSAEAIALAAYEEAFGPLAYITNTLDSTKTVKDLFEAAQTDEALDATLKAKRAKFTITNNTNAKLTVAKIAKDKKTEVGVTLTYTDDDVSTTFTAPVYFDTIVYALSSEPHYPYDATTYQWDDSNAGENYTVYLFAKVITAGNDDVKIAQLDALNTEIQKVTAVATEFDNNGKTYFEAAYSAVNEPEFNGYSDTAFVNIGSVAVSKKEGASLTGDKATTKATMSVKAGETALQTLSTSIAILKNKVVMNNLKIEGATAESFWLGYDGFDTEVWDSVNGIVKGDGAGELTITGETNADGATLKLEAKSDNAKLIKEVSDVHITPGEPGQPNTFSFTAKVIEGVTGVAHLTITANDVAKSSAVAAVFVEDDSVSLKSTKLVLDNALVTPTANLVSVFDTKYYASVTLGELDAEASKTFTFDGNILGLAADFDRTKVTKDQTFEISVPYTVTGAGNYSSVYTETNNNNKGTLKVQVTIKKATDPKFKVTQTEKLNVAYRNKVVALTVSAPDGVNIVNVEATGNEYFDAGYNVEDDVIYVNATEKLNNIIATGNAKAKKNALKAANRKLNLKVLLAGYANPVEFKYTLSAVNKQPKIKLSSKKATLYPEAGIDSAKTTILVGGVAQNPWDYGFSLSTAAKKGKKKLAGDYSWDGKYSTETDDNGNVIIRRGDLAEDTSAVITLTIGNGEGEEPLALNKPVKVKFATTVKKNQFKIKLSNSKPQINANAEAEMDAALISVLSKDGGQLPDDVVYSAKAKKAATDYFDIEEGSEPNTLIISWKDGIKKPGKGTFTYTVTATSADGSKSSTALKITVKNSTVAAAVTLTQKKSLDMMDDTSEIVITPKYAKHLHDVIADVEISGGNKVDDNANTMFYLAAQDNGTFLDEKGAMHLKLNPFYSGSISTKDKFTLKLTFVTAESGMEFTKTLKAFKIKQSKPKLTASTKTIKVSAVDNRASNVYDLKLTAKYKGNDVVIDDVTLVPNKKTNGLFGVYYGGGNDVPIGQLTALKKGATYTLKLKVHYAKQASNSKDATVTVKVKVSK